MLLTGPAWVPQNVEESYYQQSLLPDLRQLGYEGQFVAAPGGGIIGVATFWATRTFRLLKVTVVACLFLFT